MVRHMQQTAYILGFPTSVRRKVIAISIHSSCLNSNILILWFFKHQRTYEGSILIIFLLTRNLEESFFFHILRVMRQCDYFAQNKEILRRDSCMQTYERLSFGRKV